MECHCYLRNVSRPPGREENSFERRFGQPLEGSTIPFGVVVEDHPQAKRDQARLHQFGKKVLPGILLGYALIAGDYGKETF